MKLKLSPLLLVISLTACQQNTALESNFFSLDTMINVKLYEGEKIDLEYVKQIITYYSDISDNYQHLGHVPNIYDINQTNNEIETYEEVYDLIKKSFDVKNEGAINFNPLCGSLAKKWKNAINNQQILAENIINEELDKINNTSISFLDNNVIKKEGEGEIDLGGIAKGYALDISLQYLEEQNIHHYLINAGMSSILLGEKQTSDGLFSVGLDQVNISNGYIRLKNCFVSTSAIYRQSEIIDGKVYSHIVNPYTGSVNAVNDAVIVVSDKGYIGDALSTSMMMNTLDEIKVIEQNQKVKTIVIRDNKIIYKNEGIEIYYH